MKTFRELKVWEKSMLMVTKVYNITNGFPNEEVYGLTSQIKRSATSMSSLFELQTQIEIAYNLNYFSKEEFYKRYEDSR